MDITAIINEEKGNPPEAIEPEVQPEPVVETPEPEVEAEAPPAPEPEPEPAPEAEPEPKEAKSVPLATFLDVRDELKEAKRKAAELEARQAQQQAPADVPDPIDDPKGFAAHQNAVLQEALTAQRFEMSDFMARQQHGEETVKAAADWATEKASADPLFKQAYMQQPHPLDWIVREHKRSALMNEIGDNVDDWFTREAAKRGFQPTAPNTAPAPAVAATPQATKPAVPPRSIASDATAPAAAGDPSADFMAIFQR